MNRIESWGRVARASAEEMKWGAPHVGFTCGSFGLTVPRVYPPTRSIVTSPASPFA